MFVCGTVDGLLNVGGRRHNCDDLKATILAVDPIKFVYRGRIAIFSIPVLKDDRIVVVAEQRPNCTEEEVCVVTTVFHCYALIETTIMTGKLGNMLPSIKQIVCYLYKL